MPNVTIYEKIAQKAMDDAHKILEAGEAKAKAALDAAVADAEARNAALMAKTMEKNANLVKTRTTEFEQAERQNVLSLKKTLIARVQIEALDLIQHLPEAEWRKFVIQTVAADELMGQETIIAAPADRKRFVSAFASGTDDHDLLVLDRLNLALKNPKYALVLSTKTAPIDGGFLLEGTDFDIDHSYAAFITALKDRYESELATILFDGRE